MVILYISKYSKYDKTTKECRVMKKRKLNLLIDIAIVCLCVCAIAIGVYSAKTASLNVSGTIGFTAHNCKVRVLGKITGAVDADNVAITSDTSTAKINYTDPSDPLKGKLIEGTADKWDFGNIYFDDLNTDKDHEVNDIVFTFTITNESAFDVDVTVNQNFINDNRIFMDAPNNVETLSPQGQVTITVKFQLQKVDGEYSNLNSAINATLLNFEKSQAPSYLANNWITQIKTGFNLSNLESITSISFLNKINDSILSGFVQDNGTYKTVSVGAVNETSNAGNLTTSVTDVVAYYKSGDSPEIVIYSPARIYAPESCAHMFSSCSALTNLNLSNFDTSKVAVMWEMFYTCDKLTRLDVSNFDTSNVTDMSEMFRACKALTSLDLSSFNTSSVTNMSSMFSGCKALTSLDLSNFNTSSVTSMSYMFSSCSKLTSLDVSNFDTSKVTDMHYMFGGCSALTSLDLSNFDTSKVTSMMDMFYNCSKLTSLDLSKFITSNVTNMSYMFSGCSALTSLNLSNFNTSSVTDMNCMFKSCSKLTSLDLRNFDTSKVISMGGHNENNGGMFNSCENLTSLNLSSFNTSSVTDMRYMFYNCSKLTSLNLSNFNTNSVTDMSYMFSGCSALISLDVSSFDTSKVTSMSSMFSSCSKLTSLDLSSFNTSSVKGMGWMFESCYKLTSLDVSNFNTSSVVSMNGMFSGCSALTNLDVRKFDTSKVIYGMNDMFRYCSKLTSLDLSNFDTSNVKEMRFMFASCSELKTIYVNSSKWSTKNVTIDSNMFYNCTNLVGSAGTKYNYSNKDDKTYAKVDGGTSDPGYFTEKQQQTG